MLADWFGAAVYSVESTILNRAHVTFSPAGQFELRCAAFMNDNKFTFIYSTYIYFYVIFLFLTEVLWSIPGPQQKTGVHLKLAPYHLMTVSISVYLTVLITIATPWSEAKNLVLSLSCTVFVLWRYSSIDAFQIHSMAIMTSLFC